MTYVTFQMLVLKVTNWHVVVPDGTVRQPTQIDGGTQYRKRQNASSATELRITENIWQFSTRKHVTIIFTTNEIHL